jgi:hypothetical protein
MGISTQHFYYFVHLLHYSSAPFAQLISSSSFPSSVG